MLFSTVARCVGPLEENMVFPPFLCDLLTIPDKTFPELNEVTLIMKSQWMSEVPIQFSPER